MTKSTLLQFAAGLMACMFLIATPIARASGEQDFCARPELGSTPILAEGRVMPLFSHAERVRKFLFPKETCSNFSATELYCRLSLGRTKSITDPVSCNLKSLRLDHAKTVELLGLPAGAKSVSINWVNDRKEDLLRAYQELEAEGKQNTGFGTDLSNLLSRASQLDTIERGEDWKIAVEVGKFRSVATLSSDPMAEHLETMILSAGAKVTADESSSLAWETAYERSKPFSISMVICLVGFLLSLLPARSKKVEFAGRATLATLIFVEIYGLAARVMISGRAPVTNMYETVLWAGLGLFVVSLILGVRLNDRRIWALGYAGNAVCLLMMSLATSMLDGAIKPLVPVLRDNFWLSTHVMTITFSYACFGLSWLIANLTLLTAKSVDHWNQVNRLAIQIGSVFLAAGILLGGVWADYSWGRFWGWDPKETWSLIALVMYMIILHGRYVGWFRGLNFASMTAIGFLFVLMAWFGVNYILAAGLHSYGFSSGGAGFLLAVFSAQCLILAYSRYVARGARVRA